MKRTIKFRAWIGNKMEYNVVAGLGNGYYINEKAEMITKYESSPIMQSTGLSDKNGKEIHEGNTLAESLGNKLVYLLEQGLITLK